MLTFFSLSLSGVYEELLFLVWCHFGRDLFPGLSLIQSLPFSIVLLSIRSYQWIILLESCLMLEGFKTSITSVSLVQSTLFDLISLNLNWGSKPAELCFILFKVQVNVLLPPDYVFVNFRAFVNLHFVELLYWSSCVSNSNDVRINIYKCNLLDLIFDSLIYNTYHHFQNCVLKLYL